MTEERKKGNKRKLHRGKEKPGRWSEVLRKENETNKQMSEQQHNCDNAQKSRMSTIAIGCGNGSTMQTASHLKEKGLCQARTISIGGGRGVVLHFTRLDGDLALTSVEKIQK